MTSRNFNNTTTVGTLNTGVSSGDTNLVVDDFSGNPTAPFTITVARNTVAEEICLVTAVVGPTLTVTRGYDGTAAQAHSAGATIEHTAIALDFQEANDHVNATADVHGTTGDLVGTEGAQSLMDKTLVAGTHEADVTGGDAVTATIPVGAEARNLFKGVNSGGSTVFTVESDGDTTAHNIHATGTLETDSNLQVDGDATVGDDLTVTGTATIGDGAVVTGNVSSTGNVTGVNGTFSGDVSVGDDLTVTDAISGASLTLTGTARLAEAELIDSGSDLSAPVSGVSSLYSKTDFGLYFRPNGQTTRRAKMHWGSGTTLPTTGAIVGDTFQHTGLGSMMVMTAAATWRQARGPVAIATMDDRPTAAALHAGFQVLASDTGIVYTYDGTYWRGGLHGGFTPTAATAGDYITGLFLSSTGTTSSAGIVSLAIGHTFSDTPTATCNPGSVGGTNGYTLYRDTLSSATHLSVQCYRFDGGVVNTQLVRINSIVIGYNN